MPPRTARLLESYKGSHSQMARCFGPTRTVRTRRLSEGVSCEIFSCIPPVCCWECSPYPPLQERKHRRQTPSLRLKGRFPICLEIGAIPWEQGAAGLSFPTQVKKRQEPRKTTHPISPGHWPS